MRIGMILDTPYPDDARITNQCEELIKAKNEVFLFCLSYNKEFLKNEAVNQIEIRRYYCSNVVYKLSALANDNKLYGKFLIKKIVDFIETNIV